MLDAIIPFAIAFALLAFIIVPLLGLRRQGARRRAAASERLRTEAAARGVQYQGAAGDGTLGQPPASPSTPHGAHLFSGSGGGLPWSATVEGRLAPDGDGRRHNVTQRTRIHFTTPTAAPGRFLLTMALPPTVTIPPVAAPGAGLLGQLADRAVEGLLDLYVTGFFGAEHRQLVNVAGAARPDGPPGVLVLSTDPALAAKLLDSEGRALLEALHHPGAGPEVSLPERRAREGFGLLVTDSGLTFGCQITLGEPDALRVVAERVAGLASHARGGQAR